MPWSDEQLAFARAWSAALLAFGKVAFVRGTITDVVAWTDPVQFENPRKSYMSLSVALVGDGMKVARTFGYLRADGGGEVDLGAVSGPVAFAARKILMAKEMAQDIGRDQVSLPDLLSRLEGQAAYEFCDAHGIEMPFDETTARLLIEPGYPWPEDDRPGIAYFSAKQQKMIRPERPGWLIQVEDRDNPGKTKLGVNPCAVFPVEPQRRQWNLWGRAGKQDLIVAHSMTLLPTRDTPAFPFLGPKSHKDTDTAISSIRACGGLLFPSLSVGALPASNFGPITLVGHLGLALDGLKPYGSSKDATSWVYPHDAWTVSTGDLMREVAVQLFDELHGHESYIYGRNIWALGPPAELFSSPHGLKDFLEGRQNDGSTPIRTVRELVTAVKKRGAVFKRGMSREEFEAADEAVSGTIDKYFYCEAKARRVISLDEFPFMVGPEALAEKMRSFANGVGYKGKIVTLRDPFMVDDDMADDRDHRLFQWSWLVADAVKKLGDPLELR